MLAYPNCYLMRILKEGQPLDQSKIPYYQRIKGLGRATACAPCAQRQGVNAGKEGRKLRGRRGIETDNRRGGLMRIILGEFELS